MKGAQKDECRKNVTDTTAMSARDRFGGYGSGRRQRSGDVDVRKERVDIFVAKLLEFHISCPAHEPDPYDEIVVLELHEQAKGILCGDGKQLKISADEIKDFCMAITSLQHIKGFSFKAGIFINALMSESEDSEFIIPTSQFDRKLDLIGCRLKQKITIKGDAGDFLGSYGYCDIIVEGNAGDYVGHYSFDGTILVKGCAGDCVGYKMEGGSITVKGDAGDFVGDGMLGGTITVEGNAGDNVGFDPYHGKIIIEGDCGENVGEVCDVDFLNEQWCEALGYDWDTEKFEFETAEDVDDGTLESLPMLKIRINGKCGGMAHPPEDMFCLVYEKGKLISQPKRDMLRWFFESGD